MSAPINKIKRFLEGILDRSAESNVVLSLVNVAGKKSEIWTSDKRWTVDDSASQIVESAKGVADGQHGVSKFSLQGFSPEGGLLSTISFAVAAEEMGGDDNALSEPANQDGLLAQLMRHTETLHRQSAGTYGVMFGHLTRIIDRQSEQIEKLTTEKANTAENVEALISRKHERDLETKQVEVQMARRGEIFDKIMTLLPVAVNKLTGKELVRQNDTLFEITTSEFLQSMSSQKLDALVTSGILDKNQITLFITMLEQLSKRMITTEEKKEGSKAAKDAIFSGLGTTSG